MNKRRNLLACIIAAGVLFTLSSCSNSAGDTNTTSTTPKSDFITVTGATVSGAVTGSSVFIEGRTVIIPNLLVCDHEVTQAEYEAVTGSNPSNFTSAPADGETQAKRPVECVSWYDALVYCNKRSISENLTPCYTISSKTNPSEWGDVPTSSDATWNVATCDFNANGYRLPTEAEWEYIARGGNKGIPATQTTYSGSSTIGDVAWSFENSGLKTHEVKKKNANSLGIYDMRGNVWEWCWDWYGTISSTTDKVGAASGSYRVLRGGSWGNDAVYCSVAYRYNYDGPDYCDDHVGFRVVRSAN